MVFLIAAAIDGVNEEPAQPVGQAAAEKKNGFLLQVVVQVFGRILLVEQRPTVLDQVVFSLGEGSIRGAGGPEQVVHAGGRGRDESGWADRLRSSPLAE